MMHTRVLLAMSVVLFAVSSAGAAVKTKAITYMYDGTTFKGHLAWDDTAKGKRPGVLVVHEFWGLDDYARKRAEQLAGLGYVAFACDMYGDGKFTKHPNEALEMATHVRQNIEEWQKRATAALEILKQQPECDATHLAAMGYCFGGSTALMLAYTGADLDAVITFHAALPTPSAEQAKAIKATIVICHGALDSFIPDQAIHEFRKALDEAGADYEFDIYAKSKHSFTVPDADSHGNPGMSYNKLADERSWSRLQHLFAEKLGTPRS